MIKYVKPKHFRQIHGDICGSRDPDTKEITLPYKASTTTKLHELGHNAFNHPSGEITLRELFNQEVDAEIYAFQHMGRAIDYRVLAPAVSTIADCNYLSPHEVLGLCKDKMADCGIPFNRYDKSELWGILKRTCRKHKHVRRGRNYRKRF